MLSELVLPAPAKLNLFLHIIGRRADGYHSLQTLFQFLDFGDELAFFLNTGHKGVELISTLPGVPHEDNLIVKAARLLQEASGTGMGVRIRLEKRLPMGGGLGGGSSNAATTLLGLNALWGLEFSEDRLAELGLQLGADVPVFVRGRSAFAQGVGEILTPVSPQERWYLVLLPDVHVDTTAMYGHKDLTRNTPPITFFAPLEQGGSPQQESAQQQQILSVQGNDFEPLVRRLYPEVDKSLALLDNLASLSS
ncbi:MAG: 4-(cytidine 5'-diphospho)-2-C-methyl-D-erythritol kinase, partial [Endozoicomonas sp.]